MPSTVCLGKVSVSLLKFASITHALAECPVSARLRCVFTACGWLALDSTRVSARAGKIPLWEFGLAQRTQIKVALFPSAFPAYPLPLGGTGELKQYPLLLSQAKLHSGR